MLWKSSIIDLIYFFSTHNNLEHLGPTFILVSKEIRNVHHSLDRPRLECKWYVAVNRITGKRNILLQCEL